MNNAGYVNPMVVPLIMSVILTIILGFFSVKYYNDFKTQKTEVDAIVAQAVESATAQQADELNADFEQRLKSPHEKYTAASEFNAVAVTYPRTWSSYVETSDSGGTALDGYFHPGTVPGATSGQKYALRLTLERADYAETVDDWQRDVESGELKANAITVNGIRGIKLSGLLDKDTTGVMVILPIRDKVLLIWTESNLYEDDFNQIIIPKLKFDA